MKKSALLVIDVQNEMFQVHDPVYEGDRLLHNLKQLIAKARSGGIPVIYIQHNDEGLKAGSEAWKINPEITPAMSDTVIQKTRPDSFYRTTLEEELKGRGIEHVILAGMQSELCVDTTCRRASSLGYDVTLVSDAHSTWNNSALTAQQIIDHVNATLRWFADIKTTEEILCTEEAGA
ncbi:MAG: cysteine hydrolase [Paenibacillus lautus]|uniref:cysteine hydrolase family protein n=1 Tax=Paenibacillus lautus TaxID=1401 RepID=UPI0026EDE8D6|nr:cysteine hydrolase family protein [Paenibacillus lautus]MCI1773026.1 cysteine hydrolase [Paenibacillus lautus]